jgi:ATP-dependent DNA helicase MPH1
MAWLLEGDEEPDIDIYDSPTLNRERRSARPSPNHDDTVETADQYIPSSSVGRSSCRLGLQPDDSIEILEDNLVEIIPSKPSTASPLLPVHINSLSPGRNKSHRNADMLPPELPNRVTIPSPISDVEYLEQSFAVRPVGKRPKKRVVLPNDPESPLLKKARSPQRRLHRKRPESTPSPVSSSRRKRSTNSAAARKFNPWIDTEAAHSGDDVSDGSSQVDEVETKSDQQFLEDYAETQVSPSYDQTLAYRQSLFTQAPARGKAPAFPNRPAIRGAYYAARPAVRARPPISSSPPIHGDPDEYAMGSFVVDDSAEITYASSDT